MKKYLLILILFSTLISAKGQSLIPNGDFENYVTCPDDISQLERATNWITPTHGTSDYFNECTTNWLIDVPENLLGYQVPHSGVGYVGIFFYDIIFTMTLHYREYLEVRLTSPLVIGECYHFEMYINLSNTSAYAVSDIGVYFSDTLIEVDTTEDYLHLLPQITNATGYITDTVNWIKFSGNYNAHGGENYLLIGNFLPDSLTDTLFVNANTSLEHHAYYHIDDVSLILCSQIGFEEHSKKEHLLVYPTPFSDNLTFSSVENEASEIILYDITARKIMESKYSGSVTLNTGQLSKGIYFYEVKNKNGEVVKGKVVKE